MPSFDRQVVRLSPTEMHATDFPDRVRSMLVPELNTERTLVLGSTQDIDAFDEARCLELGIEVTRRRSGGGAVLVSDADLVWFDLIIGSDDPLWTPDVAKAFEWVGRAIQAALSSLGHITDMHTGKLLASDWSRRICFAGTGPGELSLDGQKVVGISQRRTRDHARFQVAILRQWNGQDHAELLALSDDERRTAATELDMAATGIVDDPAAILDVVQTELPG